MALVTIKTFSSNIELTLVKSYLESEGIECFVQDELTNQVYAGMINELHAKLQVDEQDAAEAINLLISKGYAKKEDYEMPESMLWLDKLRRSILKFFGKKDE